MLGVLNFEFFLFFLLGDSPASEFCADVSELSVSSIFIGGVRILPAYTAYEDGPDRLFRNVGTKFRQQRITQKKEYNIQHGESFKLGFMQFNASKNIQACGLK